MLIVATVSQGGATIVNNYGALLYLVAALLTIAAGAAAAFSIGNSRRKDITITTWKELYEAKEQSEKECLGRIATLEGRVDTLTSDFARNIAHEVANALQKTLLRRHLVEDEPQRQRAPRQRAERKD